METNDTRAKIDSARHESTVARWRKAYPGALVLIAIAALSVGCASYRGTATNAQPSVVAQQGQWTMVRNFPHVPQAGDKDCGAAALAAVLRYWGHAASPESIEAALGRADNRLQAGDMEAYARGLGLRSYVFYGTMKDVVHELEQGRPVIVGLGKMVEEKKALSHYEVVVGYEPNKKQVLLLDPARGWQVDSLEGFAKEWAISKAVTIVAFPERGSSTAGVVAMEGLARAAIIPPSTDVSSVTEAERYAARESASPEAKKYRGGDYIVISASALAVILLVVLIIILI
ncbi:MAG TPA: cysteine peptidase family C39 domain-containing protein [Polyangiaceae bacterium]|jgi:predicted double-glycine peptidase|nr:cysteine peptidase family C39 domain-containing protein [Polyangiaceae bacterium]